MPKQTRAKRKSSGVSRGAPLPKKAAARTKKTKANKVEEPAPRPPLPAAWRIGWRALRMLWQYKTFFLLLVLVYLVLDLLLVRSIAAFDVASLRNGLDASLKHGAGLALGGLSVFSSLFSAAASGASADATGAYHFFVILLMSLTTIWALRQIFTSDNELAQLSVKRAFYKSSAPLVPFLLIMFLIGLQFIPLFIALQIYALIINGGIANAAIEQLLLMGALVGVLVLTIVWFTRTIMALYIVTLPDMQPMQAYKDAKVLVKGRRLSIIRKLLFLPIAMFVIAGIVMVPCILIWAPLAQWLFFVLTGIGFVAVHAYLYTLYRELLA
ncbi:hypothetical protein BH09PAT4_BH09PAT4_00870 [soil metagenome]